MPKETRFSDYAAFLSTLDKNNIAYFLEGGQAVNLWAEYFVSKSTHASLLKLRPFVSKDCDIWVDHDAVEFIENHFRNDELLKGTSPVDGQIAIFTIKGNPSLTVDLLSGVYGISPLLNQKLNQRALSFGGLRVLDSLYLFKSKCHCLMGLPQADRQDRKHLLILSIILPKYLSELLIQVNQQVITERQLIRELKLLLKINTLNVVKMALKEIDCKLEGLFPITDLKLTQFTSIKKFTEMTLIPQLSNR